MPITTQAIAAATAARRLAVIERWQHAFEIVSFLRSQDVSLKQVAEFLNQSHVESNGVPWSPVRVSRVQRLAEETGYGADNRPKDGKIVDITPSEAGLWVVMIDPLDGRSPLNFHGPSPASVISALKASGWTLSGPSHLAELAKRTS